MKLGLNLFSIRTSIQGEEAFSDTCRRLSEMGYDFVQFSGAPFDAPMLKRVMDQTHMPILLTHVPEQRILEDTDALMEEHALLGCSYIGLGSIPPEDLKDEAAFKAKIARLEAAAAHMSERGFTFFYHNHHRELAKLENGQTRFEYMIEHAPHIHFTVDTYWLQMGGVSILEYFEKLKGRMECVHLKDLQMVWSENTVVPKIAACGDGNINMTACIQKAIECGAKYFFVEQDDACTYEDPFHEVEKSVHHIKSLEVAK